MTARGADILMPMSGVMMVYGAACKLDVINHEVCINHLSQHRL